VWGGDNCFIFFLCVVLKVGVGGVRCAFAPDNRSAGVTCWRDSEYSRRVFVWEKKCGW